MIYIIYLQKAQKQNTTTGLRTCNNILAMTQVWNQFCFLGYKYMFMYLVLIFPLMFETQLLHSKAPSFIGDKRINLSWKEIPKVLPPSATTTAGYVISSFENK